MATLPVLPRSPASAPLLKLYFDFLSHAVYCVDAKFNFDDNAQFRQAPIFALRDTSMEASPP